MSSTPEGEAAELTMNRLSQRATESALRAVLARVAEAPARLADILAESQEPLVAFTAQRTILFANLQAEQLFGYGPQELAGRSTDAIVPERLRQPGAPPMVATTDLMTVDLPALRRDGSELPLAWTFGAAPGPDAPIFVMTVRDRMQLDETLEALRASEERFRLLVDGVRDHAIFMLDGGGRVSTWNTGAERIKGYSAAEIVGRPYERFFTDVERAARTPSGILAAALADGVTPANGWRVRRDGTSFYAESSVSALRSGEGALRGYAVVTHDLTARMRAEENERRLAEERAARRAAEAAEERARISEERLRRLHRMATALARAATPGEVAAVAMEECVAAAGAEGGGIYMLSEGGRSLELLRESGHAPGALDAFRTLQLDEATPLTDAVRAGAAAFYEARSEWPRAGARGTGSRWSPRTAEYPELHGGVAGVPFEASAVLPLTARGLAVGVLSVRYVEARRFSESERSLLLTMSEICAQALERARLFAAEQRARAEAESANRAKDEFLAMLGHELRNPLAPIAMAIELMKLRSDEGTKRERDVIERQVRHMTKLVDDLLDVSRIARGLVELSREDVEIAQVVPRAVEMASPLLEQREHQLSIDVPTSGLMVHADPARLAQVLANLLTNAAKYTHPRGSIALGAALEGDDVVVRVRDDGEGISPDLLPSIFDLFVQGKRTLARAEGGLGLGLALVRNLVAMHGGKVAASSAGAGRGSEFVVRIPAAPEVSAPPSPSRGEDASPARRVRRVLVVDDNADAAEMLTAGLRHVGYEVEWALDGLAALERLRCFDAEVAILDLGLPVIDGYELARRIAAERGGRRPRLIAVTGYGQEHDLARSRAAGFDAHLTKPAEMSAIVAAIEERETPGPQGFAGAFRAR